MKFNMNNKIKYKMKPIGEKIWLDYWRETYKIYGLELKLPEKDDNGYCTDSMWKVMSVFGQHFHNGQNNPIETEIILEIK